MSDGSSDLEIERLRARIAELEAQLDLARERARIDALHSAIVARAPIGLGIADVAGDFVVYNDAMLAASGFSPGQDAEWKKSRASEAAQASRSRLLEVVFKQGGLFAPISREGALVLNNLLLTTACAAVFVGTLYPLALEALTGDKISVGPPFFNLTFVPLIVPLLIAVPFGPLLAWKRGDLLAAAQRPNG